MPKYIVTFPAYEWEGEAENESEAQAIASIQRQHDIINSGEDWPIVEPVTALCGYCYKRPANKGDTLCEECAIKNIQ